MPQDTTPTKSIEERVNQKFYHGIPTEEMGTNQVDEAELVAFIKQVLEEERDKAYREKQNAYNEGEKMGAGVMRTRLREAVEKMRDKYVIDCMSGRVEKVVPYDRACNEVLSLLKP